MAQERERPNQREETLYQLSEILQPEGCVLAARVYGSFLTRRDALLPDLDLAIMIPSDNGVVDHTTYKNLLHLRTYLCNTLKHDIDLIPHTLDEVEEQSSPLWNPRYHPSFHFGINVKGNFPIPESISCIQNASVYILLDNRTITRRQLLRLSFQENWRIFLAKLIHGPGNALTLQALQNGHRYVVNPSDIEQSFSMFDKMYGTDSRTIIKQFRHAELLIQQNIFSFEHALQFIRWYEAFVATVLGYDKEALQKHLQILTSTA